MGSQKTLLKQRSRPMSLAINLWQSKPKADITPSSYEAMVAGSVIQPGRPEPNKCFVLGSNNVTYDQYWSSTLKTNVMAFSTRQMKSKIEPNLVINCFLLEPVTEVPVLRVVYRSALELELSYRKVT